MGEKFHQAIRMIHSSICKLLLKQKQCHRDLWAYSMSGLQVREGEMNCDLLCFVSDHSSPLWAECSSLQGSQAIGNSTYLHLFLSMSLLVHSLVKVPNHWPPLYALCSWKTTDLECLTQVLWQRWPRGLRKWRQADPWDSMASQPSLPVNYRPVQRPFLKN